MPETFFDQMMYMAILLLKILAICVSYTHFGVKAAPVPR